MFKTETHLHTCEVSACGKKHATELVRLYKERGYTTVFVTDHFQPNSLDALGDLPWEDKVTVFLSGYYKAKQLGDQLGVTVLPGAELCFPEAPNHYLAYGITRQFLNAHPDLHKVGIEAFRKIAREEGIFIVQAHPYRDGRCFPTPEYADAIEVYNSNPRHEDHSELAEKMAIEHSLPMTAGSDTHRDEDIAGTGVLSEAPIRSAEDYIALLKSGKAQIIK